MSIMTAEMLLSVFCRNGIYIRPERDSIISPGIQKTDQTRLHTDINEFYRISFTYLF